MSGKKQVEIDFLILTSIRVEFDAVRNRFPDYEVMDESSIKVLVEGRTGLVASMNGIGTVLAAIKSVEMLVHWDPKIVLLVGLCGGFKEMGVRIGDLIVATSIVDLEIQKITDESVCPKPTKIETASHLLEAVQSMLAEDVERRKPYGKNPTAMQDVLFGPVYSGNKIIASSGFVSERLESDHRRSIKPGLAVEMEGGGVAIACNRYEKPFLVFRGVSDLADKNKSDDAQADTAESVADFTYSFLEYYYQPPGEAKPKKEQVVPEYNVLMLGHRGVGKTSVLAAMQYDFGKVVKKAGLSFRCMPGTVKEMRDKFYELENAKDNLEKSNPNHKRPATRHEALYSFELSANKSSLALKFTDIPGGMLVDSIDKLREMMTRMNAVLILFDTPELMDGRMGRLNRPSDIPKLLERLEFSELSHPKTIVFVPTRCEFWIRQNRLKEVIERLKIEYETALNYLAGIQELTAVFIPVETIGNIEFSYFAKDGIPRFVGVPNRAFHPWNCDAILGYLLRQAFEISRQMYERNSKILDQEMNSYSSAFKIWVSLYNLLWGSTNDQRQRVNLSELISESETLMHRATTAMPTNASIEVLVDNRTVHS